MRFLFSVILFSLSTSLGFAQTTFVIRPENADCKKPVEIKDTIFGPTNTPAGSGDLMEISADKSSLYEFEKEHNTCWYFFKAKYDAYLEIDIIPQNIKDDYDFILYKYSGKTFCPDIAEKKIKPVRSCISRNDKKIGSRTGLSKDAVDEYIHSGPGPSYSKGIQIKNGEIYYLVVDNVYPNGSGHTVILHYSGIKKTTEPVKPENKTVQNTKPQASAKTKVSITVVDKDTQQPVKTQLKIFYNNKAAEKPLFTADSVSSFEAELPLSGSFVVKTEALSYFDNTTSFKTGASAENINIKIQISKIKVGQNVVFENILFYGNSAQILPESKPVIEGIAATLKRNSGLKIEIQGHVNCPTTWPDCDDMSERNMQLSVNRAKAVYDFLSDSGIDPQKMTFKGFGASRMVYPDARSEEKMEKNRRVEILITGIE